MLLTRILQFSFQKRPLVQPIFKKVAYSGLGYLPLGGYLLNFKVGTLFFFPPFFQRGTI